MDILLHKAMRSNANALIVLAVLALATSGCASVSVNSADDLLTAGDKVNTAIKTASATTIKSDNDLKAVVIAFANNGSEIKGQPDAGVQCNLAINKNYLRTRMFDFLSGHQNPSTKPNSPQWPFLVGNQELVDVLAKVSGGKLPGGCEALLKCEEHPDAAPCRSICYSTEPVGTPPGADHSDETSCINQIAALDSNKNVTLSKDAHEKIALALSLAAYPESQDPALLMESAALDTLSSYLSLLAKAATPQPTWLDRRFTAWGVAPKTTITDESGRLAKRAESARSSYNSAEKTLTSLGIKDLPHIGGLTDQAISSRASAIGALADTFNGLVKSEDEGAAIRKVVADENVQKINDAITTLKCAVKVDTINALNREGLANQRIRIKYQEEWANEKDPIKRLKHLQDAESYKLITASDVAAVVGSSTCDATAKDKNYRPSTVDSYFDALVKAHEALVTLIKNPTDDDRRKEAEAALGNLIAIGKDLVDIYAQFK
jgi:hypothetical protein